MEVYDILTTIEEPSQCRDRTKKRERERETQELPGGRCGRSLRSAMDSRVSGRNDIHSRRKGGQEAILYRIDYQNDEIGPTKKGADVGGYSLLFINSSRGERCVHFVQFDCSF